MRFSDLKKKQGPPPLPSEESLPRAVEPSLPPPKRISTPPPPPVIDHAAARVVERAAAAKAAALDARSLAAQRQEARAIYSRGIALVREIFGNGGAQHEGCFVSLGRVAEELAAMTAAGNQQLVVLTASGTQDDPALAHSLNVAIYALKLGVGLRLPAPELKRLGMAALLHDLGHPRSYRLGTEKGISSGEAVRIRDWLRASETQLAQFGDAPADALAALSGTISKLHSGAAAETAAQIISLCDLYEAFTHGYDGAAPVAPREAFKALVALKDQFDHALVKRLLEELSPFPPGSLVKLTDGRVGCVVAVNGKLLTRPVIEVWLQADGKAQEPPESIDLSNELLMGVAGSPDEAKLLSSPAAGRVLALRTWSDA